MNTEQTRIINAALKTMLHYMPDFTIGDKTEALEYARVCNDLESLVRPEVKPVPEPLVLVSALSVKHATQLVTENGIKCKWEFVPRRFLEEREAILQRVGRNPDAILIGKFSNAEYAHLKESTEQAELTYKSVRPCMTSSFGVGSVETNMKPTNCYPSVADAAQVLGVCKQSIADKVANEEIYILSGDLGVARGYTLLPNKNGNGGYLWFEVECKMQCGGDK